MARPRIELNQEQFEELCRIQCTLAEIASVLRCSSDTVERWTKRIYGTGFAETYKKFAADGKTSLRRSQFRLAEKNAAMAIWLGKQYLDQRDSVQFEDAEALARLDAILKEMGNATKQQAD